MSDRPTIREIAMTDDGTAALRIVSFGEVLWDNLPSGPVAGGAPMNVALRLRSLGVRSDIITAVGNDASGERLRDLLRTSGVGTSFIQTCTSAPTGEVNVTLDASGIPSYDIVAPSAWDSISIDERNSMAVREADAFVFGSLSCRNEHSHDALLELLPQARYAVFDVNLRAPHYSIALVEALMTASDMIKLNDEELTILSADSGATDLRTNMRLLSERSGASMVCVTRGKDGAVVYSEGRFTEHPGFRVTVKDTVGSGDSFLAGFLAKRLNGAAIAEALEFACAVGALVAMHSGANPDIALEDITALMRSRGL